ncbi:MAG: KOW domain-containing RNA-binding protein [Ruminococcus sp.]|nr:KOW domain-containing RNA-binding protein [Ruminococcus sp.]
MDIVVGSVVRAKAGRDKGGYFVVTDILENGRVLICDGKRRKVLSPKQKNINHLEATKTVAKDITTNRQIKSFLKSYLEGNDV